MDIKNLLPYSVFIVILVFVTLLAAGAIAFRNRTMVRCVMSCAALLCIPVALLAYSGEWTLWSPKPKRLPILNLRQLEDFQPGDAISLGVNSRAFFNDRKFAAGVVIPERIASLQPSILKQMGPHSADSSLIWLLNAKASTVVAGHTKIMILDAKIEGTGMWVGWIPDPLSTHLEDIDAPE